jgi:MFS family permease
MSTPPKARNDAPPRRRHAPPEVESSYAWARLVVALLLSTIGGVGMWSVVVALPAVQIEFGVARADASLPYTLTMIGFGLAGILMGRLSDRFGILLPLLAGTGAMALGFVTASTAPALAQFSLVQGLLIGAGSSATFAPLLADTSQWFSRRRGMAVGIFASGNYLSGTLWPPLLQHFIASQGWRATYLGVGLFCLLSMVPLALLLRRRPPPVEVGPAHGLAASRSLRPLGLSPNALQSLLIVAGIACCVAMSMPQVHLVAYCSDLGYGPARGAQMLSLMLACGIVSRLTFGWISDRIGGLRTLLLGSSLQAFGLLLFLPFDGLASLYVVSATFGLSQGGIVPSYAIIIREYFLPKEAGVRVSTVITFTLFGMALGGWMSGAIFDLTGSYRTAFVNGVLWNVLNISIALFLLRLATRRLAHA